MADDIKNKFISEFERNRNILLPDSNPVVGNIRAVAFEKFKTLGIPDKNDEEWKHTDINPFIKPDYIQHIKRPGFEFKIEEVFKCDVPELNTLSLITINGWYFQQHEKLSSIPENCIVGSFAEAVKKYPDIVEKYYSKYSFDSKNGLTALNTAFAQDGIFIYIPRNTKIECPIQIVNIVNYPENSIVQQRNLIIAEEGSEVKLVFCEHSLYFNKSFINSVTEIIAGENSKIDVYNVQNSSNNTAQHFELDICQKTNSRVTSGVFTLHGGFVRNNTNVLLNGEKCETELNGLYLSDREQHVDNNTFIDHAFPNCRSNEKYKGIIDDKAHGVFSGKILVRQNSQKTTAFQSNNNLLLTDEARINTKPHLEIFADDVKCGHGATTGQMDTEAMFYLRSRGINENEARQMLMYAFAAEIINKIDIKPLRERIDDLVSKRLRGELSRCNNCVIKCS